MGPTGGGRREYRVGVYEGRRPQESDRGRGGAPGARNQAIGTGAEEEERAIARCVMKYNPERAHESPGLTCQLNVARLIHRMPGAGIRSVYERQRVRMNKSTPESTAMVLGLLYAIG